MVVAATTATVDGGGGAAAGGRRAQSTVKSGNRKNERRGGGGGDSDGVGNKQQSNKSGIEKNGGFCNGGGDGDGVDNGDHDDSGIDDGDGNNGGVIIVNGLVKIYITINIIRRWERRSDYRRTPPPPPTTTKMTTRGEDHRRGRRRKIIVSDETKDIEAPAEIGTRGWGGRGWALSLSAVAMDRSELPRAMPTGAIERFIVSCANPQQANSQQSTSPDWVTLIHCFCCPTRIFNALSCILGMVFCCYQCFFFMMKTPSTLRAQSIG
jgi:hypothetical protein